MGGVIDCFFRVLAAGGSLDEVRNAYLMIGGRSEHVANLPRASR